MQSMRLAISIMLLSGGLALATDHPEEARRLVLKDRSGRQSLAWIAKLPAPVLPGTSPTTVDATLVVSGAGSEQATLALPAAGWTANAAGTIYKYKNAAAFAGPSPVKAVVLKDQSVLKVSAKGTGITLDEASQGTVGIVLTIGSDAYCSLCTTAERDEPGRYVAKRCPAPASCPTSTTTTITTIATTSTIESTTSTTLTGVCGDGAVNQPSEQCDGMDFGHCLDNGIPPFPFQCDPPTAPEPCTCCLTRQCVITAGGSGGGCCGDSTCWDTTGVGSVRGGICAPPTCTQSSDCNYDGYDCVGGVCCGLPGTLCPPTGCCPGTGSICKSFGSTNGICCLPSGSACTAGFQCCSDVCTGGTCE